MVFYSKTPSLSNILYSLLYSSMSIVASSFLLLHSIEKKKKKWLLNGMP